jgi:hypothetical protein
MATSFFFFGLIYDFSWILCSLVFLDSEVPLIYLFFWALWAANSKTLEGVVIKLSVFVVNWGGFFDENLGGNCWGNEIILIEILMRFWEIDGFLLLCRNWLGKFQIKGQTKGYFDGNLRRLIIEFFNDFHNFWYFFKTFLDLRVNILL